MGLETMQPLSDAPKAGLVAGQTIGRCFTNIWKNEPVRSACLRATQT
jgi:hypothetical protein